jgi:hypothetical protein
VVPQHLGLEAGPAAGGDFPLLAGRAEVVPPEWDAYRFWAGGATRSGDKAQEAVTSLMRHAYLFTENETNAPALYGSRDAGYFKDGINEYVVSGKRAAVNPDGVGTKAAAYYKFTIPAGQSVTVRCRLRHASEGVADVFSEFDGVFDARIKEADRYYESLQTDIPDRDARRVQRQAVAGLIWTKQFYQYDTYRWLKGDSATVTPPEQRWYTRNSTWQHFKAVDILSMPDKWEYPYFCAWDTAFHAVAFAPFDPEFAKDQLLLLCREWYTHPNGQLPAYEWNFSDANPPVHAWAAWRVFQIDRKHRHSLPHRRARTARAPRSGRRRRRLGLPRTRVPQADD